MHKDVEILEKTVCYKGFFRIDRYRLRHRLFNGGWSPPVTRELFERGHAAAVLPYDPLRNEVVLIEQFRIGAMNTPDGPWLLEIVAGIIEPDEITEDVVKRESMEEANCNISDLIPLYDYLASPGGMTERIALFCGRTDTTLAGGIHAVSYTHLDVYKRQTRQWRIARHMQYEQACIELIAFPHFLGCNRPHSGKFRYIMQCCQCLWRTLYQ